MPTTLNQNPWAVEKGAAECRLVHLLGAEEDPREGKLSRIYRTLGYRPIEASWPVRWNNGLGACSLERPLLICQRRMRHTMLFSV